MVCVICFEVQKYTFSSVWQNFFLMLLFFSIFAISKMTEKAVVLSHKSFIPNIKLQLKQTDV